MFGCISLILMLYSFCTRTYSLIFSGTVILCLGQQILMQIQTSSSACFNTDTVLQFYKSTQAFSLNFRQFPTISNTNQRNYDTVKLFMHIKTNFLTLVLAARALFHRFRRQISTIIHSFILYFRLTWDMQKYSLNSLTALESQKRSRTLTNWQIPQLQIRAGDRRPRQNTEREREKWGQNEEDWKTHAHTVAAEKFARSTNFRRGFSSTFKSKFEQKTQLKICW